MPACSALLLVVLAALAAGCAAGSTPAVPLSGISGERSGGTAYLSQLGYGGGSGVIAVTRFE